MPTTQQKRTPARSSTVTPASRVKKSISDPLAWLDRRIGQLLIAIGAIGTFASLALSIEEFHLLKHPQSALGCDLNPIINCGGNMTVWQGHVFFGMPNAFLGLLMFVAIMTIGAGILAGATFKRWFWLALEAGMAFGLLFVHWFIYESIFVLQHLCPYCMMTWVVTITGFWYITLYTIRRGYLQLPQSWKVVTAFAQRHHLDILIAWFLIIIAVVTQHFWYYWKTIL